MTGTDSDTPATTAKDANDPSGRRWLKYAVASLMIIAIAVLFVQRATDDGKSTTTSAFKTSTTLSPTEEQILRDYRAFWEAYLQASNPVRPDHPLLQKHATGREYEQLVKSSTALKAGDELIKGSVDVNPRVASLNATEALVKDCLLDRTGIYDAKTGERKDTEDTQRQLNTATMQLVDGTWKVSLLVKESVGCTGPQ